MRIHAPGPSMDEMRSADDACVAGVLAKDPELRRRIGAALAAGGIRAVDAGSLDAVFDPPAAPHWDALVIASDLDAIPELLRTGRRRVGRRLAVVLVGPDESSARLLHRALRAGLDGCVLDSQVAAALAPTVRAVLADQVVVPRSERRQLLPDALSHREKEVLAMVVLGYSNGQIGHRLFLAESTVKSHLTSIFTKLGVRSRSEAAALVLDPRGPLGAAVRAAHRGLHQPLREVARR